jgi:YVTN family beta-propeller protein
MKPGIACICLAIWVTSLMLATAATSSAQIFGYITDNMDRTVSVIDTTSDTVVATIDVGIPYPYGVACHPDGKTVYVSGTGVANAGTVFLIDVATQTLADSVAVGATARGLAVLPDGSAVYVANNGDDTVSVIDTNTFSVVGTIPVGVGPHGVVAHPDGSMVYVSNVLGPSVSVIDVATATVTATVPVVSQPRGITIDPEGDFVYVGNYMVDSVSVIDTATNTVVDTIIVGGVDPDFPVALAMHPDGSTLYVSLHKLSFAVPPIGAVSVVDTATRSQTQVITGFWLPHGLAVHPDGSRLYVAESQDDAVSVVDTSSNTIVDTVSVGYFPVAFGDFLTPALIFADGFESGDLSAWSASVP